MKRTLQQYVTSEWSEIRTVTPDGGQPPAAPQVTGISRQGNAALIALEPVKKATGYRVSYQEKGATKTVAVHASLARYIIITDLKKGHPYTFTVTTENAAGTSPATVPANHLTTTVQK